MKRIMVMVAGIALALNAQATVTLNIDAEALKDSSGTRIAEGSGLTLLVADTLNNGFASVLNPGTSLALGGLLNGGDDQIVARWSVESGGFGPGVLSVNAAGVSLGGNWNAGDGLAIYWFANATTASASGLAGMQYNLNASTKSGAWVTPSDGGLSSMSWFTTDATELGSGSVPAINGNASLVIVPEPSSVMLVGLGLLGLVGLIRRRR